MAGNQPDSARTANAAPRPDCGPPGTLRGDDNTSGYDEHKPTSFAERDGPDPTAAGSRPAQTGTEPTPTPDPYDPGIDQPVPPGDVPSKTPIKEPERGEAQYVDAAADPQAIYSDAAHPVVPGPADGAD
jgi:hypothetical protein